MPLDKNGRVKKFNPPLCPLRGRSKVKYLNFAITKPVVNIFFTEIVHADRGAIDMKPIKQYFSLKA